MSRSSSTKVYKDFPNNHHRPKLRLTNRHTTSRNIPYLMAGSRQHLFTEAMANMERVVGEATKDLRPKLGEKQPLDDVILGKIKEEAEKEAYTVIDDACKLAEELLGIPDNETRWEFMHRVWVGMLCYSASMCRSDLHAKSLGEGGEFLSNVWLLISLIGGRTLADKLQMPDDDPEPEGKVVEDPAKDKGEQKPKPEAAGSSVATTVLLLFQTMALAILFISELFTCVCLLLICR